MSDRASFHFYPANVADYAQTFFLDWNVANPLVLLYDGQRFEQDQVLRERLVDLDRRFPPNGAAVAGFAAVEPEARPRRESFDGSRLERRAAIAVAMLEQGHGRFERYLNGDADPRSDIKLHPPGLETVNPTAFAELWVNPAYAILLQATVLKETIADESRRVEKFEFWLNHELEYRPSREVWLGMLLLAGTRKGRELATNLLKLGKSRTSGDRIKDLWGGAWDIFYTRLPGFGNFGGFLSESKPPFVFVTNDEKLHQALVDVELLGTTTTTAGNDLGAEWMPLEGLINPASMSLVKASIAKLNDKAMNQVLSPDRRTKVIKKKARRQIKILERELAKLCRE